MWEYTVILAFEEEGTSEALERVLKSRFLIFLTKLIEKEKRLLGIARNVQMLAPQKED